MNLKPKCVQCHKELASGFRMILMMGPQGFRKYAVCEKCAKEVERSEKSNRSNRSNELATNKRMMVEER
jgi:hypothetical protein